MDQVDYANELVHFSCSTCHKGPTACQQHIGMSCGVAADKLSGVASGSCLHVTSVADGAAFEPVIHQIPEFLRC